MNQYKILERLSAGSFGIVFKTVRTTDSKVVVLKRIPLGELDGEGKRTALMEVELMKQLHHPHIVQHRDAFLYNEEDLCIVMDYYGGGDLDSVIRHASDQNKPLSEQQVVLWFVEMALAIHYLHSHRIVHRDLKSHNIFINSGNGEVAVGDFGVAKILEVTSSTRGSSTGTPLYMAPEVLNGGPATFKSDIWSLGCILYELLCRKHPFQSSDLSGLVVKVSRGEFAPIPKNYSKPLAKLVEKMLERDPRRRPLIDEVLVSPFIRPFVKTYLSIRVPLEVSSSVSEQMLTRQIAALGIALDDPTQNTEEHLNHTLGSHSTRELEDLSSPSAQYRGERVQQQQPSGGGGGPQRRGRSNEPAVVRSVSESGLEPPRSRHGGSSAVDDMRGKTIFEIESEVAKYRRLVQEELRQQDRSRSSSPHPAPRSRRGGGPMSTSEVSLQAMPQGPSFDPNVLDHPLSPSTAVGSLSHASLTTLPPQSFAPPPPVGSSSTAHLETSFGRRNTNTSSFYRAMGSHAVHRAALPATTQRPTELSKVQRRRQLHQQCVDALGVRCFNEVYGYFANVAVALRDVDMMRRMVPDRQHWGVLPSVDEIVQLDQSMMSV